MKKIYLLTCLLVAVSLYAEAQSFYAIRRDRSLIVTFGTGTASYFGELNNPGDFIDAKPNIDLGLQYFILPTIELRGGITWFQLSGSDLEDNSGDRLKRNLSFVSDNYEISFTGALHLKPMNFRYYQRPPFNAYVFAGLGLLYFNPRAELDGIKYSLQPMMTEGVSYGRTQIVIPVGGGVKVKAGPFFNFALEGGYRKTFTDYLDDVSTVHPDKSTWTNPIRIALSDRGPEVDAAPRPAGSIRGNPDKNDGYFLMNLKVEYYLPMAFGKQNMRSYKQKRRRPYNR